MNEPLERLTKQPRDPAERAAADLLRDLSPPPALQPAALAQIAQRVRARRSHGWRMPFVARLALAGTSLVLVAEVAWAAVGFYRAPEPAQPLAGKVWRAIHPQRVQGESPTQATVVPQAAVEPATPEVAPEPTAAPAAPPTPTLLAEREPSPAPRPTRAAQPRAPAPNTNPLSEELEWLKHARSLKDDPPAELKQLEGYLARYPRGTFRPEAVVMRLDTLLATGASAQALATLDALHANQYAGLPRAQELAVLRAELLAGANRCPEALGDLPPLGGEAAPLIDRTLHVRALCRGRTHDPAGSRADWLEYLRRFPQGRFAAAARAALGQDPAASP